MKKSEVITTKKGLKKEWEKAVDKNQDGYGHAVIKVVVKVCKLLDEGKSPEIAEDKGIKGSGITGFMAGAMTSMITYFHPRGDEFKKYWNKKFDPKPRKGVINPAIMTIKIKKGEL